MKTDLRTSRLLLREIREEDIADIHEMNSFEAVARHNTTGIPKNAHSRIPTLEFPIKHLLFINKRKKSSGIMFLKK